VRRLTRYTLNALTILSLLLFLATLTVWVRSYRTRDLITYFIDVGPQRQIEWHAGSNYSWLWAGFGRTMRPSSLPTAQGLRWWHDDAEAMTEQEVSSSLGSLPPQINLPPLKVRWTRRLAQPGDTIWTFVIVTRLWLLSLLSAILPGVYVLRLKIRYARRRSGACPSCNYDLRATPDRCPECGTVVARTE
jgi:hypothetical protein